MVLDVPRGGCPVSWIVDEIAQAHRTGLLVLGVPPDRAAKARAAAVVIAHACDREDAVELLTMLGLPHRPPRAAKRTRATRGPVATHYAYDTDAPAAAPARVRGYPACGMVRTDLALTTDLDAVSCRGCLRSGPYRKASA